MSYLKFARKFNDVFGKVCIIRDDPKFLNFKEARDFYKQLKGFVETKGFISEFAPSDPFSIPDKEAVLWLGHGQGNRKLSRAPRGIRILAFGSDKGYAINHPVENEMFECHRKEMKENTFRSFPIREHFIFSNRMQNDLSQVLHEIRSNRQGYKYYGFRGVDHKEIKLEKPKFVKRFFS